MGINKLDCIFNPQRIALIGVTINPNSVGGKVLSNIVGSGFRGVVYPVNPKSEAVLGIQCYPDIKSLPKTPDLAVICTGADEVPDLVEECGREGINGIIIMSAGFKEEGEKGRALEKRVREIARNYKDMRIIGPNCLGIIVPDKYLNVSFAPGVPAKGNIAFISQSGALCTSVLDWAIKEKIGFSNFVSIGNTLDVDFGDLIDYFGEDENTKSILLYIESITDARKFMTSARAFAHSKPIVAYKAGRFPESAKVAASHTGALASEDDVYDAAFKRIGVTRVYDIGEIFDCAELIGRNKIPKGPNLAIITNAGGPGVMATDALIQLGGTLAKLSEETIIKLNQNLPSFWSKGNPVDVLGDAPSKRIAKAVEIVLKDKGADALLVILTPQAMTNAVATAKSISLLTETTSKPVIAIWMGGEKMDEGIRILNNNKIATYSTPEQGVKAFMNLVEYSRNIVSLYQTPKDLPVIFDKDRKEIQKKFNPLFEKPGAILSEEVSKEILEAYGIPVSKPVLVRDLNEAIKVSGEIGYPVVMKIYSPEITHKTEVNGVELNITDENKLQVAFSRMMKGVKAKMPEARIEGVTLQKMIKLQDSIEMILGTKKDTVFGTVILAGMGGIYAELFKDKTLAFPPLNERLAYRMLESLKIFPLLQGYRGKPPMNMDKLIEILIRLSYLAADFPQIKELDINPVLVSPGECIALDARIIVEPEILDKFAAPYSHLALKPYPEEFVKNVTSGDGTEILLRPIKPEDEPMWLEMLSSCSKETIYSRFRYFFQWDSHKTATRYCFIDYDREIAIVAEIIEKGVRKFVGVGRLIADVDHESVEFAILVTDKWQNRGVGSIITDYCMGVSKHWGLKKIVAQTTTDNHRMINVFQKRGFNVTPDAGSSLVDASKNIE